MNTRHKNIKFTIEQDQKLPCLDVLITKTSNNRITTNYKKSADTGLLTNYLILKISVRFGKNICRLLMQINNTQSGFHNNMEKIKCILQKNLFLPELIDKVVRNYLSNQCNSKEYQNKKVGRHLKLLYVGVFF